MDAPWCYVQTYLRSVVQNKRSGVFLMPQGEDFGQSEQKLHKACGQNTIFGIRVLPG
jgi:hypothetical protein